MQVSTNFLTSPSRLPLEKRFGNGCGLVVLDRRPQPDVPLDRLPWLDLHLYRCRVEAQIRVGFILASPRTADQPPRAAACFTKPQLMLKDGHESYRQGAPQYLIPPTSATFSRSERGLLPGVAGRRYLDSPAKR